MPNPDFTGTVSRMRCETCKHWKWDPSLPKAGFVSWAHCLHPDRSGIMTVTTDLTVCSNWERNPSSAE